MAMKHPEKVVDLLAYSSLIVNASRSYEEMPWLDYNNHFRCAKAADRSATGSFAEVDSSIWTLHFGRAISKQVCKDCFEPGHWSCKIDEVTETRTKDTLKTARSRAWKTGSQKRDK